MPYLIVQHPGGRVQQIQLTKSPTVLGRGIGCDLQIIDPKISRRHCQLVEHEGQWYLEDLPSRNQTWMGMQAVDQIVLADGDQFHIGGTYLIFRTEDDPTKLFENSPDWS
ncbi:MAG: FHA domain-containing protein [Phycisphaerae bacterium]|nr:FHA domain-containing protein [Phycisphaerae bacterium]